MITRFLFAEFPTQDAVAPAEADSDWASPLTCVPQVICGAFLCWWLFSAPVSSGRPIGEAESRPIILCSWPAEV